MLNKKKNPSRLEVLGAIEVYQEWYATKYMNDFLEPGYDDCFWNGTNLVSEESCNSGGCSLFYNDETDSYRDISINWYENDLITVEVYDEDENIVETYYL